MWQIPDIIMTACTRAMGEPIMIVSGINTATVMGIYEEATNVDEVDGLANLENFRSMVDFRAQDLTFVPKRKDIVTVPRTGKVYRIVSVDSDGWARHRCFLMDDP